MLLEKDMHDASNTYVFMTKVEEGAEPAYIDNVVSYSEGNNYLSLELAVPKTNPTEWLISWLRMPENTLFSVFRTDEDEKPLLSTDHHVVQNLGYDISGDIKKGGNTTITLHYETAATLRVGEKEKIDE